MVSFLKSRTKHFTAVCPQRAGMAHRLNTSVEGMQFLCTTDQNKGTQSFPLNASDIILEGNDMRASCLLRRKNQKKQTQKWSEAVNNPFSHQLLCHLLSQLHRCMKHRAWLFSGHRGGSLTTRHLRKQPRLQATCWQRRTALCKTVLPKCGFGVSQNSPHNGMSETHFGEWLFWPQYVQIAENLD